MRDICIIIYIGYLMVSYADIASVILIHYLKNSFRNRISRLATKNCCNFIVCDCDIEIIQVIFCCQYWNITYSWDDFNILTWRKLARKVNNDSVQDKLVLMKSSPETLLTVDSRPRFESDSMISLKHFFNVFSSATWRFFPVIAVANILASSCSLC